MHWLDHLIHESFTVLIHIRFLNFVFEYDREEGMICNRNEQVFLTARIEAPCNWYNDISSFMSQILFSIQCVNNGEIYSDIFFSYSPCLYNLLNKAIISDSPYPLALPSTCLSVILWTEPCLLCNFPCMCRIHFKFGLTNHDGNVSQMLLLTNLIFIDFFKWVLCLYLYLAKFQNGDLGSAVHISTLYCNKTHLFNTDAWDAFKKKAIMNVVFSGSEQWNFSMYFQNWSWECLNRLVQSYFLYSNCA